MCKSSNRRDNLCLEIKRDIKEKSLRKFFFCYFTKSKILIYRNFYFLFVRFWFMSLCHRIIKV